MWAKKLIKKKPFKLVVVALAKKIAHRLRDAARQDNLSGNPRRTVFASFAWRKYPPALMLCAGPLPQSFHHARTGADGFTGFRINPLSCASRLGHLDSRAILAFGELRTLPTPSLRPRSAQRRKK
jgi:hypothetical protein